MKQRIASLVLIASLISLFARPQNKADDINWHLAHVVATSLQKSRFMKSGGKVLRKNYLAEKPNGERKTTNRWQ
jgi:hypothetical protein